MVYKGDGGCLLKGCVLALQRPSSPHTADNAEKRLRGLVQADTSRKLSSVFRAQPLDHDHSQFERWCLDAFPPAVVESFPTAFPCH